MPDGITALDIFAMISGAVAMIATVVALVLATGVKPLRRSIDKLDATITNMAESGTEQFRDIGVLTSEISNLKDRVAKLELLLATQEQTTKRDKP